MIQLILVFGAFGCSILGVLVLLNNYRNIINILSAAIDFCLSIWLASILVFMQTTNLGVAFVSAKMYYIVAAIFVALLTIFAFVFPKGELLSKFIKLSTAVTASLIVISIIVIPDFITKNVIISSVGNSINVDKVSYLIYSIYFLFYFLFGVGVIVQKFLKSGKKIRSQLYVYLIGIMTMALPGLVTNLVLPYYGNYEFIWVSPALASVFLVIVSYGITRLGMFDIKLAAVRSSAYIMSLTTLSIAYYYLAYLTSLLFFKEGVGTGVSANPVNIVLALLLAFIFQPIKRFFDRVTNKLFYKNGYNTEDFYARLNKTLAITTDLRDLLRRISIIIGDALKSDQAFFYINTFNEHYVTAGTHGHKKIPKTDIIQFEDSVNTEEGLIVASLLDVNSSLYKLMVSHRVEIVLPLKQSNQVLGYLCLGNHKTLGYTIRDMKVLSTISDELVIAIQNALSIQEVKDLNENLQQRIDSATKELRASNSQLQRLDKAKDEFVSMASHQLRTPLTSIKGYTSMILDGDVGEINETMRHMLEEAFMSSERMVHLINDFLNMSRIQTGKFMIEKIQSDLSKVVKQEIDSLKPSATAHDLEFKYTKPANFPTIKIDEGKIRQVIMNFADNAIYYSKSKSKIDVSLEFNKGHIMFKVKDNGIGVPKSEQAQLFSKFYRASNAKTQRPDGTGVGLYLAKRIIDAHKGKIIFESVEGKGSTFGFSIPLKQD